MSFGPTGSCRRVGPAAGCWWSRTTWRSAAFSTQVLQDLGYETTWAANAEEALDRSGERGADFDVVFSDVVMPGMGGIELAKELRRRLPDLPVVLASGYSHVLAEEGAHGFDLLHKPYSA